MKATNIERAHIWIDRLCSNEHAVIFVINRISVGDFKDPSILCSAPPLSCEGCPKIYVGDSKMHLCCSSAINGVFSKEMLSDAKHLLTEKFPEYFI